MYFWPRFSSSSVRGWRVFFHCSLRAMLVWWGFWSWTSGHPKWKRTCMNKKKQDTTCFNICCARMRGIELQIFAVTFWFSFLWSNSLSSYDCGEWLCAFRRHSLYSLSFRFRSNVYQHSFLLHSMLDWYRVLFILRLVFSAPLKHGK